MNSEPTKYVVDYYMGDTVLPSVSFCRDLGITDSDLSPAQHINDITVKAHRRANLILRCFVTKDTAVLLRAYIVYKWKKLNRLKRCVRTTVINALLTPR